MTWTPILEDKEAHAGPWRTWRFGLDLRLEPTETWDPGPKVSTKGVAEEGLETLLMLNLDRLFGGWSLRLNEKYAGAWDGADLQATDPTGCRHVFEVKYGARVDHVVDQALAYALSVVGERSTTFFDQQDREDQKLFLARRVVGFWTATRSDKWAGDKTLPPRERSVKALENHAADRGLNADQFLTLGEDWSKELAERAAKAPDGTYGTTPTEIHFHLVVPNPAGIAPDQRSALARLLHRGVRASIWQAAVEKGDNAGRLSVRQIVLTPRDPNKGVFDERAGKSEHPVSQLVAQMTLLDPDLAAKVRWHYSRGNLAYFGNHWYGKVPSFRVHVGEARVRIEIEAVVPGSMAEDVGRLRHEAVTAWVQRLAPPQDGATRATLQGLRKKRLEWSATCPETDKLLDAWRSGGLSMSRVDFALDDDLVGAAQVCNRAIRVLLEVAGERPKAFP